MPASIYWKNLAGAYLGCNKYMLNMAGLESIDQIIGKTDFEMPWQKQAPKIRELDQLVISDGKTYEFEESPTLHNGLIQTFLSSKTPLLDKNNEIIGIIGVSIDITEKKESQQILIDTDRLYITRFLHFYKKFILTTI